MRATARRRCARRPPADSDRRWRSRPRRSRSSAAARRRRARRDASAASSSGDHRGCSSAKLLQQLGKPFWIDRLDEMIVEAGRQGALPVGRLSIPGQRDESLRLIGLAPNEARDLVAVEDREPEIDERNVGLEPRGGADALGTVGGLVHLVALLLEE